MTFTGLRALRLGMVGAVLAVPSIVAIAQAQAEVSAGGEVTVTAGEPTPIYGARGECGADTPPSFERVIEQGLGTRPEHGRLSDGGVGERFSRQCQGNVPIRIILYTSAPDYTGQDTLVIYGDSTDITVEAP